MRLLPLPSAAAAARSASGSGPGGTLLPRLDALERVLKRAPEPAGNGPVYRFDPAKRDLLGGFFAAQGFFAARGLGCWQREEEKVPRLAL